MQKWPSDSIQWNGEKEAVSYSVDSFDGCCRFARPGRVRNATIEAYWFSRRYVIQDLRYSLVQLGCVPLSAVHFGAYIFSVIS